MRFWHLAVTRLRSLLLRKNAERDLDEELQLHLERELDRKLAEGIPIEQARRDLREEFGPLEQIKEECREARGLALLEEAVQDAHYGARTLLRSPGFLVTVLLTLALGIGANTAIFSVVYGVLWKPLPIRDSERLAAIWLVPPAGGPAPATTAPASSQRVRTGWQGNLEDGRNTPELAPADFADVREQSRVFEQVAGAAPYSFTLTGMGEPVVLKGWQVSRGFFSVAGVGSFLGRTFLPADHLPGASRTILLSYSGWQSLFGGAPDIVGASVRLDGVPSTIVGVMPKGFDLPVGGYYSAVQMWTPMPDNVTSLRVRESAYWPVMARLTPGAQWEQAQQELDAIAARLAEQYPQSNAARRFRLMPIRDHLVGISRPAIWVLAGAVGLVLLIACANVACLLMMRRSQRRRELAVRLALGAGRSRIARQLMVEHALLAAAGTVLGVALSYALVPALLALNPATSPLFAEVAVDGVVLAFSLVLCAITALLFGLAPALRFASSEPWRGLELGPASVGENRPAQRLRGALVVSQIALSVALLAGAGLLGRSFANLLSVDPGLRTEGILSAQTGFFGVVGRDDARSAALVRDVTAKIAALPGVLAAGAVSNLPMHETPVDYRSPCSIEGRPATSGESVRRCLATIITPDYFRTTGIALEEGRVFNDRDIAGAERVIVINRTMARRWDGASPLGAKVRLSGFPVNDVATVVGVVRDVVHSRPDADPEPEVYMPHAQAPVYLMTFVLRTNTDPMTLVSPVRSLLREAIPNMPLGKIATLDQFRSESFRPERFNAVLLIAFAGLALLVAAVGLYGVIGYAVTLRLPEFALRFALGASRGDIIRGVLTDGLKLVAAGIGVGLALALAVTQVIANLLFQLGTSDVGTYAAITGLTVVVACIACLLPARRASLVNPASALR